MESGISVKVFVGCAIQAQLRLHLKQSIAWKNAKIAGQVDKASLVETPHDGQEFIGQFVPALPVKVEDIQRLQEDVLAQLRLYCPDMDLRSLKCVIFPQSFIS